MTELIVCGFAGVAILEVAEGRPREVWRWRPEEDEGLPEYLRDPAAWATSDCKPVRGGRQILITSSLSGIALVERETKRAGFYATGENAHSADLLPGNRIAVATSGPHEEAVHRGNPSRLMIFDEAAPEKEVWHTELPWGHGVVWDEGRQILWALAISELRAYRLKDPGLELVWSLGLPEGGAHELSPAPGSALLMLSTEEHCWVFDRDAKTLAPHPELGEAGQVKSMDVNPVTGQLAYVQAEGGTWWAERIRFLYPEGVVEVAGIVYKARWGVEDRAGDPAGRPYGVRR